MGAGDRANPGAGKPNAPGAPGVARAPKAAAPLHVIRTAELHLQVSRVTESLARARTATEAAGGFVGNESTERDASGYVYSRVSLRVPQDKYSETLTFLENSGGKLLARKAEAKDVTDEVVDIDSRIKSQRVSVARVQEFMDRATKLSDVVAMEAELSSRQATLESLIAQQASLKDRTGMATITLVLSEVPPKKKPAPPEKDDEPGFVDALGGGWEAFVTTVRWISMVVGAVAPFAVTLGLLYLLWRKVVAPRLPAKRTRTASAFPSYPAAPGLPRQDRPADSAPGTAEPRTADPRTTDGETPPRS
ncbi:hypothetical protein GCM10018773_12680 [Streptomyces candidus]|nr:hypothetical protein GCM10018773_12680 [Streptomyces candidus]